MSNFIQKQTKFILLFTQTIVSLLIYTKISNATELVSSVHAHTCVISGAICSQQVLINPVHIKTVKIAPNIQETVPTLTFSQSTNSYRNYTDGYFYAINPNQYNPFNSIKIRNFNKTKSISVKIWIQDTLTSNLDFIGSTSVTQLTLFSFDFAKKIRPIRIFFEFNHDIKPGDFDVILD